MTPRPGALGPVIAMTRSEILRARGYTPAELARPTPDDHEDDAMPETTTTPCRECGGPLPVGRTAYCGEECHKVADRNRAREAYRRKAAASLKERKPAFEAAVRKAAAEGRKVAFLDEAEVEALAVARAEPSTPVLNGRASLVAELLALPGVGEVELEVDGHRLTVRPREAA